MNFKNFFKRKNKELLNASTVNSLCDFETTGSCRHFLENLYIEGVKVKAITLANGYECKVEDIPEEQVVQRAKEIRSAIHGRPQLHV